MLSTTRHSTRWTSSTQACNAVTIIVTKNPYSCKRIGVFLNRKSCRKSFIQLAPLPLSLLFLRTKAGNSSPRSRGWIRKSSYYYSDLRILLTKCATGLSYSLKLDGMSICIAASSTTASNLLAYSKTLTSPTRTAGVSPIHGKPKRWQMPIKHSTTQAALLPTLPFPLSDQRRQAKNPVPLFLPTPPLRGWGWATRGFLLPLPSVVISCAAAKAKATRGCWRRCGGQGARQDFLFGNNFLSIKLETLHEKQVSLHQRPD